MTPVSPSPYGMVHTPGMNISVDLGISLINLRTGQSWTQQRQRSSNWQPMQVNLLGGRGRRGNDSCCPPWRGR